MSIQKFSNKFKGYVSNSDILIPLVIIAIGAGSFGLGRLSALLEEKERISFLDASHPFAESVAGESAAVAKNAENKTASYAAPVDGGLLVGSREGTKYHFPWCSSAERIKEENKIWFSSREEAENAGYTPAANCKGL